MPHSDWLRYSLSIKHLDYELDISIARELTRVQSESTITHRIQERIGIHQATCPARYSCDKQWRAPPKGEGGTYSHDPLIFFDFFPCSPLTKPLAPENVSVTFP